MDRTKSYQSPVAWMCLLITLVIGLSADLYTKYEAYDALFDERMEMPDGQSRLFSRTYEFIPDYLHFTYHENRGAVFGVGQGARTLFITVSFFALGLLGYLFYQSGRQHFYQILLGMLAAGVLGNLYDRWFYGYVRDMIYIFPKAEIFPWIFNIADTLLCCGVAGMFALTIFRRDPSHAQPSQESTGDQS